jgi:hypothetical protein
MIMSRLYPMPFHLELPLPYRGSLSSISKPSSTGM